MWRENEGIACGHPFVNRPTLTPDSFWISRQEGTTEATRISHILIIRGKRLGQFPGPLQVYARGGNNAALPGKSDGPACLRQQKLAGFTTHASRSCPGGSGVELALASGTRAQGSQYRGPSVDAAQQPGIQGANSALREFATTPEQRQLPGHSRCQIS